MGVGIFMTVAGVLARVRARRLGLRRQREYARLALTELDVRRLDERIDALLSVLAQVCDYSGQPDAAREFRSLCSEPAPAETPVLRLVRGQP
jgi:hypothetical protein